MPPSVSRPPPSWPAILVIAVAATPCRAAEDLPEPPPGSTWKLVWRDEFEGRKLDEAKWTAQPERQRKGGWWSPRAVALDGQGHLVIRTFRDGNKVLDGCVSTQGKFEHAHGFYVARIRLHRQPGHWPAFWIHGKGVASVGDGGRDGCEIDIMEKPWRDDRVQHTLHWDGYGKDHRSAGHVARVPGVMQGFHTFGLWWKRDEYVFSVDGRETWRTAAGGACKEKQYIKLSDEVGDWAGDIGKATLPDEFAVDYVRVYELVDRQRPAPQAKPRASR